MAQHDNSSILPARAASRTMEISINELPPSPILDSVMIATTGSSSTVSVQSTTSTSTITTTPEDDQCAFYTRASGLVLSMFVAQDDAEDEESEPEETFSCPDIIEPVHPYTKHDRAAAKWTRGRMYAPDSLEFEWFAESGERGEGYDWEAHQRCRWSDKTRLILDDRIRRKALWYVRRSVDTKYSGRQAKMVDAATMREDQCHRSQVATKSWKTGRTVHFDEHLRMTQGDGTPEQVLPVNFSGAGESRFWSRLWKGEGSLELGERERSALAFAHECQARERALAQVSFLEELDEEIERMENRRRAGGSTGGLRSLLQQAKRESTSFGWAMWEVRRSCRKVWTRD